MTAEDDNIQTPVDAPTATPPSSAATDEPYSIFDKRQKGLIILIVSTAATCESANPAEVWYV
jgi:hypothetical protein